MKSTQVRWGHSRALSFNTQCAVIYLFYSQCIVLWSICLIHLSHVISPQAMLMRQQDRLEGRVQNIDEQLTKLESNKTLMKVQYDTNIVYCLHSELLSVQPFVIMWGFLCCNFCLCCAIMKWPRLLFAAGNWKENVIHLWLWTDSALGGKMHFTNDFLNSVLNKKVIDSTKWRKNVLRINSLLFVDEYSFLQSKVLNSAEWC